MKLDISGIKRKLRKLQNTYIRLTYRRKCRLYGVGLAKSGTTSVARMFNRTVVTRHEPMQREMAQALLDLRKGRIDRADLRALVLRRDKEYCADVNSDGINAYFVDILLEEFPDALFLLTMRDPYSWLDSAFNHQLMNLETLQEGKRRNLYRELREYDLYPHQLKHPPEEQSLEAEGLPTLDSMLAHWNQRNQTVLSTVPEHRLLIVKTRDVTKRAYEIADFAGLPRSSIQLSRSHRNQASRKHHLLEGIDRKHLDMKVQEHCGSLMKQYFPEIGSVDDMRFMV